MSTKTKNAGADKKQTVKPAKATSTKVDKQNLKNAADAVSERKSIYKYPTECKTAEDKKAFRRKARATRDALEKQIKELRNSKDDKAAKELKSKLAEQAKFQSETYA